MSAAARAEARRKAILSRGTDRLSKLTSTARGEDNPVYAHDDPPLLPLGKPSVETFVGEETIMPTPPNLGRPSTGQRVNNNMPQEGPTAWTPEQQQEFMRAFMQAGMSQSFGQQNGLSDINSRIPNGDNTFEVPADDDPMAAMMSALSKFSDTPYAQPNMDTKFSQDTTTAQKSKIDILMPVFHVIATWCLLIYFALFREPEVYNGRSHAFDRRTIWQRWAELSWRNAKDGLGVQTMSFFWAFVTLQLILHSTRIFFKRGAVQLPALLTLALPHLPFPIPSLIINGASYIVIFNILLNDIAALVVGIGLMIWISNMLAT